MKIRFLAFTAYFLLLIPAACSGGGGANSGSGVILPPSMNIAGSLATGAVARAAGSRAPTVMLASVASSPATDYPTTVLADGPIAYYRLGDTSSAMADSSGNALNGSYGANVEHGSASLTSATTNASATFPGAAPGTNDLPDVASVLKNAAFQTATTAFTVEAWISPAGLNATNSYEPIASYGREIQGEAWVIQFNPQSRANFSVKMSGGSAGSFSVNGISKLAPGNTYHIVGTYDGSMLRLYVNGTLESSTAASGKINFNGIQSQWGLGIGGALGSTLAAFPGIIDDVSIYSKTLTSTQVTNHYAMGNATSTLGTKRANFLGAFYRPQLSPPFGIFLAGATLTAPQPYPAFSTTLTGPSGYCGSVMQNGYSIESGYPTDPTKTADMVGLGVKWARIAAPQFFDDLSHLFGAGSYAFADLDSAQCTALADHSIQPVIGLEAGPVQYNAVTGQWSPQTYPQYQSAADFGQWCGVVALHEKNAFPAVNKFSLPGNEVNSNPQLFPGGESQIAAYSEACYSAIKAVNPSSFIYGFELSMDGSLNTPAFVSRLYALGCKVGTCYDGLAIHYSLRYPIPASTTPCYPNAGGDYGMQCIADVVAAAQAPIHVLISETVYTVPASVPDEQTKATAIVGELNAFAADPIIDGVLYSNVDECALYPSGYFAGGCLISTSGQTLPGYTALQRLALSLYQ